MHRFKNLEKLIQQGEIATYHKKYIAQKYALQKHFNKGDVLLVKNALDRQWIIARDKGEYIEVPMWQEIGILKIRKEDV